MILRHSDLARRLLVGEQIEFDVKFMSGRLWITTRRASSETNPAGALRVLHALIAVGAEVETGHLVEMTLLQLRASGGTLPE